MLVFALGTANGKLVCLDTDALSEEDKTFLKQRSDYLQKLSLEDKIETLRKRRPDVLRCCKTISTSNFVIDKEYSIKS